MTDLSTYTVWNLAQVIGDDAYAVRNEAEKRASVLERKIAAAKKKLDLLRAEQAVLAALHQKAIDAI